MGSAIADTTAFICKQLGISASDAIQRIKDFVSEAFGAGTPPIISEDGGLVSRGLGKSEKSKLRWLKHLKDNQLTPELRKKRLEVFGY